MSSYNLECHFVPICDRHNTYFLCVLPSLPSITLHTPLLLYQSMACLLLPFDSWWGPPQCKHLELSYLFKPLVGWYVCQHDWHVRSLFISTAPYLELAPCLSYCSIVVKRHHSQDKVQKKTSNWGLVYVSEGEFMSTMVEVWHRQAGITLEH